MSGRLSTALRVAGMIGGVVLVICAVLLGVASSDWFREQVRQRIIQESETATGGKVEIAAFDYEWRTLKAEVSGFTLRGTESPDAEPLFEAERIVIGLNVISPFRQDVNIALLEVHRPRLAIQRNADGTTNLPEPAAASDTGGGLTGTIINLAVRKFSLTDGMWKYGETEGVMSFEGRNLDASAVYDATDPGYRLNLAWKQMLIRTRDAWDVSFDADLDVTATDQGFEVHEALLETENSSLTLAGTIATGDQTSAELSVAAKLAMSEAQAPLELPVEPEGSVQFEGSLVYPGDGTYELTGEAVAQALAVRNGHVQLDQIDARSSVRATKDSIELPNVTAQTLGGEFTGTAAVQNLEDFQIGGTLAELSLIRLMPRVNVNEMVWGGRASGTLEVAGNFSGPVSGSSDLVIEPHGDEPTLEGEVHAAFDTAADVISFDDSRLLTGTSRIDFSGTLGEGIRLSVYTEDLTEILPALRLIGVSAPAPFPVALQNGVAQFGGIVTGVLDSPRVAGHIAIGPFVFEDRVLENGAADFDFDENRLRLRSLTVRHRDAEMRGDFEMSLTGWKSDPSTALSGVFEVPRGSVATFLQLAEWDLPITGNLTGTARLTGTLDEPVLTANLKTIGATAYGENVDSINADLHFTERELRIQRSVVGVAGGTLQLKGAYTPLTGNWSEGELSFEAAIKEIRASELEKLNTGDEMLEARLSGALQGSLQLRRDTQRLTALSGELTAAGVALDERSLGSAIITAETRRNVLIMSANADLKGAEIRGNAQWSLQRESFGLGEVTFRNLTLDALRALGLFGGTEREFYLDGSFDGEVGFAGPILDPAKWRGMAKVTRFEVTPVAGEKRSDRDLTLRNAEAMLFSIEPAAITVESARVLSEDTDLAVSGTLSYLRRNPWNLSFKGSVDLAVLTAFRSDLLAEGRSTIDALIRGSLMQPQINGQLKFEDASFYLRNLPNGIEQVNGLIRFNRTRATIENFTSRTGGGDLELGGFIGFGGEDWVYRLQAKAKRVRVRYPAGVSTLLDADLDLTGSSTRSLLSGDVRVTRSAFNPSSDLGGMLADSANARPPAEIENPFLRGMQFDLAIGTGSHAEFLTSLTRDIEIEADMRLRGTIVRPILLGRVGINRGEIQFFGNRYDIVQGEVTFFNPVKIEPVVAMDLETRIRSYTVMMNFSGPVDKLNFSYRSDPPLQSQEIIALLTVGRSPTYAGSSSTSTPADNSYFSSGGGSFLGHALTAPVSSRLQRFFGVSRIKIDPQLTGVDNTPETHVTIEQQVSRDITLTYVTNLTQTQQQIVRVEWNFHPDWSVYAIRDSNGVFGMDFIYRRRFK
jgi:translocation and assembly module TamB